MGRLLCKLFPEDEHVKIGSSQRSSRERDRKRRDQESPRLDFRLILDHYRKFSELYFQEIVRRYERGGDALCASTRMVDVRCSGRVRRVASLMFLF